MDDYWRLSPLTSTVPIFTEPSNAEGSSLGFTLCELI